MLLLCIAVIMERSVCEGEPPEIKVVEGKRNLYNDVVSSK